MSRSCHSATSSSAATAWPRTTRAMPEMRSAVIGLRLWGIAELPFWPTREGLLGLAQLGALQVAQLGRQAVERAGGDGHGAHELGVAVARDHLGRHRLAADAQLGEHAAPRSPGRASRRCRRRPRACPPTRRAIASASRSSLRRLSMAWPASFSPKVVGSAWMPWVRPTQSVSGVAQRHVAQRRGERGLLGQQQRARALDRQGEPGVEHVRRGHAVVDPARGRADLLVDVGQEGDHVVVGGPLQLQRALHREAGASASIAARSSAGITPSAAHARHTASSTSSQPLELGLLGPERRHRGAGVTRDHAVPPSPRRCRRASGGPRTRTSSAAA